MTDYTLAVGTHDPHGFSAGTEADAIQQAAVYIEGRYTDELKINPQEVVTLLGPGGLVTRPAERVDEFLGRVPGHHPTGDPDTLQPGDANTPDCNGD